MKTIAAISLLHEGPDCPSATRRFRDRPVLAWTIDRLRKVKLLDHLGLIAREEQLSVLRSFELPISTVERPSHNGVIESTTAAQRWSDGWRGGLLGTCCHDLGFDAGALLRLCEAEQADAVVIVNPAAALVDPELMAGLITHAANHPSAEYVFTPAAAGLNGMLLRRELLTRLAQGNGYPGRLLSYWPDLPGRDPIAKDECAPIPTAVARTLRRFILDSHSQVERLEQALANVADIFSLSAEDVIAHVGCAFGTPANPNGVPKANPTYGTGAPPVLPFPRDVTLELNTTRATIPIYSPLKLDIARPHISLDLARRIIGGLAESDECRLTLAGVGDPLLHPDVLDILAAVRDAGIPVHVETDLLDIPEATLRRLVEVGLDVLTVHIPAVTPQTYARMTGRDGYAQVIDAVRQLLEYRQSLGRGTPILVPTFVKCRDNLHEMEPWYDQWHRSVGCAVITGATDFAGQITDCAVADMSPPRRVPCRRLANRMTILCDGRAVSCEQDAWGRQAIGSLLHDNPVTLWSRLKSLRDSHANDDLSPYPLCQNCREWHRP